jgi:hypothetical protein
MNNPDDVLAERMRMQAAMSAATSAPSKERAVRTAKKLAWHQEQTKLLQAITEAREKKEAERRAASAERHRSERSALKVSLAERHRAKYGDSGGYKGVQPNLGKRVVTHCHECKLGLDPSDAVCIKCSAYVCLSCASCGCSYMPWVNYQR